MVKLDKDKYLINKDLTMTQLMLRIRKRLKLKAYEALFFHCDSFIISGQVTMTELYYKYKKQDEILYITYSSEETFG